MSKKKLIGIIVGCIIVIFVVIAIATSGEPTPTSSPSTESTPAVTEPSGIPVSAVQLYSAYKDNEVAADAQYEGKILDITGVVESIGKDILDTPYVTLTDGSEWAVWGVQCMFSKKDEATLAQLSKGQTITVRGKCDGYLVNVIVRNCTVVQQ